MAQKKAIQFPKEGGPAILEIQVPAWIVDIVGNDPIGAFNAAGGELRFEPECGLDELRAEWPNLIKRVIKL